MVKTYNICVIMNLNQNYDSKLLFLQSTAYIPRICWNLDVNLLYTMPIAMGAFRDSVPKYFCANWISMCPEKFVLNIHRNKTNLSLLTGYFVLQTSKPAYLQACFMPAYTFKLMAFWQFWLLSLQMLVISVHISSLQLVGI